MFTEHLHPERPRYRVPSVAPGHERYVVPGAAGTPGAELSPRPVRQVSSISRYPLPPLSARRATHSKCRRKIFDLTSRQVPRTCISTANTKSALSLPPQQPKCPCNSHSAIVRRVWLALPFKAHRHIQSGTHPPLSPTMWRGHTMVSDCCIFLPLNDCMSSTSVWPDLPRSSPTRTSVSRLTILFISLFTHS